MLLHLGFEVRHAGLERLYVGEQGEHDRTDGGRGGLPIREGNAERWPKLAHGASMNHYSLPVKPAYPSRLLGSGAPERLRY